MQVHGRRARFSWLALYTLYKPWKPKDSCTYQFVCLPNVGTHSIPNRSEKHALKDSGLGKFRVVRFRVVKIKDAGRFGNQRKPERTDEC